MAQLASQRRTANTLQSAHTGGKRHAVAKLAISELLAERDAPRGRRATVSRPGTYPHARRAGPVRARRGNARCLLSGDLGCIHELRDGKRQLCGDCFDRTRRHGGGTAPIWNRELDGPGERPKRRIRLQTTGPVSHPGVRAWREVDARPAELCRIPHRADGADGGMQSSRYPGAAAMPLAPVDPRPAAQQRARDDARADRQHARRQTGRGDRGCGQATPSGGHPLSTRPHRGSRSTHPRTPRL